MARFFRASSPGGSGGGVFTIPSRTPASRFSGFSSQISSIQGKQDSIDLDNAKAQYQATGDFGTYQKFLQDFITNHNSSNDIAQRVIGANALQTLNTALQTETQTQFANLKNKYNNGEISGDTFIQEGINLIAKIPDNTTAESLKGQLITVKNDLIKQSEDAGSKQRSGVAADLDLALKQGADYRDIYQKWQNLASQETDPIKRDSYLGKAQDTLVKFNDSQYDDLKDRWRVGKISPQDYANEAASLQNLAHQYGNRNLIERISDDTDKLQYVMENGGRFLGRGLGGGKGSTEWYNMKDSNGQNLLPAVLRAFKTDSVLPGTDTKATPITVMAALQDIIKDNPGGKINTNSLPEWLFGGLTLDNGSGKKAGLPVSELVPLVEKRITEINRGLWNVTTNSNGEQSIDKAKPTAIQFDSDKNQNYINGPQGTRVYIQGQVPENTNSNDKGIYIKDPVTGEEHVMIQRTDGKYQLDSYQSSVQGVPGLVRQGDNTLNPQGAIKSYTPSGEETTSNSFTNNFWNGPAGSALAGAEQFVKGINPFGRGFEVAAAGPNDFPQNAPSKPEISSSDLNNPLKTFGKSVGNTIGGLANTARGAEQQSVDAFLKMIPDNLKQFLSPQVLQKLAGYVPGTVTGLVGDFQKSEAGQAAAGAASDATTALNSVLQNAMNLINHGNSIGVDTSALSQAIQDRNNINLAQLQQSLANTQQQIDIRSQPQGNPNGTNGSSSTSSNPNPVQFGTGNTSGPYKPVNLSPQQQATSTANFAAANKVNPINVGPAPQNFQPQTIFQQKNSGGGVLSGIANFLGNLNPFK